MTFDFLKKFFNRKLTAQAELSKDLTTVYLNDPSSNLIQEVKLPSNASYPTFTIENYKGGGFELGTPANQAAQVYFVMCNLLSFVQKNLKKQIKWAGTKNLLVIPRAGKDFNAYYDRRGLKFFWGEDPETKKFIYTSDSVEIVAHELGHAILDSIRPDLWAVQSLEAMAFHEGFSDCMAILTMLQNETVMVKMLEETNETLRASNLVSRLAEEMGSAIYKTDPTKYPDCIRNAYNDFCWTAPENLPRNSPNSNLSANPHNFSRVWTGAWYDLLVAIYEKLRNGSIDPLACLRKARDEAGYLLLNSLAIATLNPRMYNSVAKAILFIDKNNGSNYQNEINRIFSERKILTKTNIIKMLSFNDVGQGKVLAFPKGKIVKDRKISSLKLEDHIDIKALENNPLFSAEIEVASEFSLEFDDKDILTDELHFSHKEIVGAAVSCVEFLHNENLVANPHEIGNKDKFFVVLDGKLVRTNISGCCCARG